MAHGTASGSIGLTHGSMEGRTSSWFSTLTEGNAEETTRGRAPRLGIYFSSRIDYNGLSNPWLRGVVTRELLRHEGQICHVSAEWLKRQEKSERQANRPEQR